jgi:hypothetical protein
VIANKKANHIISQFKVQLEVLYSILNNYNCEEDNIIKKILLQIL